MTGGWDVTFAQHKPDQFVTVLDAGHAAFAMRSGGLDARQIIDGMTIRNGQREGLGGGGFVISGDNTVISNSVFVGNTSSARGGGIYATFSASYGGKPVLSKNIVLGNRSFSANAGAGISVYPLYSQGRPIDIAISDNYIIGNRDFANRGGGLGVATSVAYNYNVLKVEVVGNVLGGNQALGGGGAAVMALGGPDSLDGELTEAVIQFGLAPEVLRQATLELMPLGADALWDACRVASRPRMDGLAQRMAASGTIQAVDRLGLEGLLALWQPGGTN